MYHQVFSFFSLSLLKKSCPCVHTAQNTHHAFLHNAKYFFRSLHYNFRTLTGRSCRISSKCNKVADNNLMQLKSFDNVSERKHTDHIHVIKHATLHTLTHTHFYQALTLNNATIKCEWQCKPKTVCYKNLGQFI
jgi:hypothetical protein